MTMSTEANGKCWTVGNIRKQISQCDVILGGLGEGDHAVSLRRISAKMKDYCDSIWITVSQFGFQLKVLVDFQKNTKVILYNNAFRSVFSR